MCTQNDPRPPKSTDLKKTQPNKPPELPKQIQKHVISLHDDTEKSPHQQTDKARKHNTMNIKHLQDKKIQRKGTNNKNAKMDASSRFMSRKRQKFGLNELVVVRIDLTKFPSLISNVIGPIQNYKNICNRQKKICISRNSKGPQNKQKVCIWCASSIREIGKLGGRATGSFGWCLRGCRDFGI